MDNVSICIPRIFLTISRSKIRKIFEDFKLGDIDYVDIHLGRNFQRVYIYFKTWSSTPYAQGIKTRLLGGEEIKVIYDDPWFWKCRLNRLHRPDKHSNVFVSKYNTRNQLIALKATLDEERMRHKQQLKNKEEEIQQLKAVGCMGDDALLRRKRLQQKAKKMHFMGSSGILFT